MKILLFLAIFVVSSFSVYGQAVQGTVVTVSSDPTGVSCTGKPKTVAYNGGVYYCNGGTYAAGSGGGGGSSNLSEAAFASFPTCNSSNKNLQYKRTDGNRDVYTCVYDGSSVYQWRSNNGGVFYVNDFGAKGDGSTNDTTAVNAAIAAAIASNTYGAEVVFGPFEYRANIVITEARGIKFRGSGRYNTLLRAATSGSPALDVNGLWYSQFEGLYFAGNGGSPTEIVRIDGNYDGSHTLRVQGNTFKDIYVDGTAGGTTPTHALSLCRVGGSSGQCSENLFLNVHFSGGSTAAYLQNGYNALNNTFIGGNFQSYPKHGAQLLAGSANFYSIGFQSTYAYTQIVNGGYDIDASTGGVTDKIIVDGCRSESLRFYNGGASQYGVIRGFNQNPSINTWATTTAFSLNAVIAKAAPSGKIMMYRVTTAGTSGGSEPTWPESGTVSDGTITWTQTDVNVINLPSGDYSERYNTAYFSDSTSVKAKRSQYADVREVTTSKTLMQNDSHVLVDATAGNITITLPDIPSFTSHGGQTLYFRRYDSSTNTVTINGATATGTGTSNLNLPPGGWMMLQISGGGSLTRRWWVVASSDSYTYRDIARISAPGNPASGYLRLFANDATGDLGCLDSSGGDCLPSGGGGGTPGGSNTQVQFNSAGSFAGDSDLTFATDTLTATKIRTGNNTLGLGLADTDVSHYLLIAPGSNLTANRTLTVTTGDSDRTINLGGNLTTAADFITSGANSLTLTTTGSTNVTLPTTGTLATLAGTETFTNKALSSPGITTGRFITSLNDTNSNELIRVTATGSAVNEITIANAATTGTPSITASGDDTNVGLNINGKGTGNVSINGVGHSSTGVITSGTWNGSVIGASYGGAGTVNGIMRANGSGTVAAVTIGSGLSFDGTTLSATGGGGGGSPGGSGSELQFRSGASSFGAVAGSSVSGGAVTLAGDFTVTGLGIFKNTGTGGLALGAAASSFPVVGYNFIPGTANAYTYASNDTAYFMQFGRNNRVSIYYAPSGTATNAITFTEGFYIDNSGNQMTRGTITAGSASTVLTDSAGKILSAALNTVAVGQGGTGLTSGTSGGIPYFSGTSTMASSGVLAANALVVGGGAGAAPTTITTGTSVIAALGVAVGNAGAIVLHNGALGTPSSGTLTNATGLPISTGVSGLGTGVATALAVATNGSGGFVTDTGTVTLTGKTIDAEATGNVITLPYNIEFIAAGMNGATAGTGLDLPASAAPTPTVVDGTNQDYAGLSFDASTDQSAQGSFLLPTGWTGSIELDYDWQANSTNAQNVVWALQTLCRATTEGDAAWNTAQTVIDANNTGAVNTRNIATISNVTTTGCVAGERLHFKIYRDADDATNDTLSVAALLKSLVFTIRIAR